jgi:deazaflavin-dependent oxidoreductase (nitroreductase family)
VEADQPATAAVQGGGARVPIPRVVAQVNRVVTNRITGLFAGHVTGFGVIVHQGRRSGRQYRTPVNVFSVPGGYLVALTYGPNSDWVKNVVAGNGCVLEVRGRRVRLINPRIVHDESRRDVPPIVRTVLGLLAVTDFLRLTTESTGPEHD